ncbi:Wzz/FepE/Etk N-terminal domain-containing protein [Photobacterium leiognathi]|uniref:Wzz/FepE/Etk N-terminal domain-containing protein n=1 Tax=Photobacterium leiognathi TaxID=553611 RepID=UPI000C39D6F4|nr:Wzz/FepE/Etk N-terminal domain-containing protein [Photobacterium leiognathi]PHZ58337.1 hypothetical protein CRG86_009665 [Photobacterium leiognathi]
MVLKEKINCAISIIKRKFTTICIINFIFLFIGGVIAFNHTEQWRTSEVIKLNNNNYSNYLSSIYKEIIQYNPLAKDNDSFDNENLFDDFLNKFNSNENKIDFMKLSLDDVGLKES